MIHHFPRFFFDFVGQVSDWLLADSTNQRLTKYVSHICTFVGTWIFILKPLIE